MRVGCSCRPKLHLVWCRRARRPEQITINRTLQALADWTSRPVTGVPIFASVPLSLRSAAPLSLCPPSVVSVCDADQRFSPLDPDSLPPTQTASPQTSPLRSAPVPRRQHHSSHQSDRSRAWPLVAAASNRFFLRSSTRQDLPSSRCPPRSSGRWRQHRRRPP